MKRSAVQVVSAVAITIVSVIAGIVLGGQLRGDSVAMAGHSSPSDERNEFTFQVDGFTSDNLGGQTQNLYFSYRYNNGLPDADIPDYRKLRTVALDYLNSIGPDENLFLEQINKTMCSKLKTEFPIEAISCQTQVLPESREISSETGIRGSTYSSSYTIGDIDSVNVPGPLFDARTSQR